MRLCASSRVVALGHFGDVYVYHQLWGYILQMSPDVYGLLRAFEGGAELEAVCAELEGTLTGQPPSELVEIFKQFRCLESDADEPLEDALAAVPVKGRWNVWRREGDELELFCAWGTRPPSRHRLDAGETAIWDAIDGEVSARALAETHGRETVLGLIERLVAIEVQALKLSPVPLSVYGHERKWPPYLTSTMPYPELDGGAAPARPELGHYHAETIDNAADQFDHVETTLAHLFRRPHPALGGRTYGDALVDALSERGLALGGKLRVVEIGGGTGDLALAAAASMREAGTELDYRIVELSPALAASQRERGLEVIEGNALAVELEGPFDLIIANEMIGDLRPSERDGATKFIERYELDVEGTGPDTLFNTGAFALMERIGGWLAPGGLAVLTEFGELHASPRISTHLDHPEISIRFGHLKAVADGLGLETDYVFVMDLLEMRRDLEGLATTRSYFRALSTLLAEAGVTLEKIGYTREMFDDLIAGLAPDSIGDIRFDKIEDRLMGLVPHEFKALIARRPHAVEA